MANQVLLKGQYGKQNPLFMYQGTGGYSLIVALDLKAVVDANNAETRLCGTLPDTAAAGYTVQTAVSAAHSVGAYTANPAQSGVSGSGTLPEPATVGYTTQGTVSAAYSAEAFAVSSAESGSSYSGTLPD